jgi:8-oxo-dGTP pyrophosphatase MutT (NUDIX family)
MPHIHTEPGQHDHTASALIFRYENDDPQVLLHTHKKIGMLIQPGGHVELHETPWQAISHEVTEETGYNFDDLRVLQPDWALTNLKEIAVHPVPLCSNTHKFPGLDHYHTDSAYVLLATAKPTRKPADGESQDIRWLTRDHVLALRSAEMYNNTKALVLHAFDTCLEWRSYPTAEFSL